MVCFIVLHYMALDQTLETVRCILGLKGEKRVVIVDNCSPNNSFDKLKELFLNEPDVILLKSDKNVGFANGNNMLLCQ